MTNKYTEINFDLYIHVNDFPKLDRGEAVIGYRQVNDTTNYELVSQYAFIQAAIKINDNQYSVCTINK
jgi:hypothetical protein